MIEYELPRNYMMEVIYYQDVYLSGKDDLSIDEVMEALKNYYDSYTRFLVSPYIEDMD